MWWIFGICSILFVGVMLTLLSKKLMADPGMNCRIVITWGEKVNEASGGIADILDDEIGGTTIVSGNLAVHHASLEHLSTGRIATGRFTREIVIGREPRSNDCSIVLYETEVSRMHCRIFWSSGQLYLEDLGSSNHTYLNGSMVTGPVPLQNDDIIYMGKEAYRYQYLG